MMLINLALLTAHEGADLLAIEQRLAARSATLGAEAVLLAPTLKPHISGGDLIWRVTFANRAAWQAAAPALSLADEVDIYRVDWAAFEAIGTGRRAPTPPGAVYRQMTLHVPGETPSDLVRQFERETLGLADHVTEILHWTLGRVVASGGDRPWTHVWEQEFARAEDFRGPYMNHPWHWGLVDRWFDPEMPERIVDRRVCNSLCALPLAAELSRPVRPSSGGR